MYQEIPMDLYCDMLQDRFDDAQNWWGNAQTEQLWPLLLDYISETGVDPEQADPKIIVDNYLVNSEIVPRDEFESGRWDYYSKRYENWDELCDDAIVYDDDYALMRF